MGAAPTTNTGTNVNTGRIGDGAAINNHDIPSAVPPGQRQITAHQVHCAIAEHHHDVALRTATADVDLVDPEIAIGNDQLVANTRWRISQADAATTVIVRGVTIRTQPTDLPKVAAIARADEEIVVTHAIVHAAVANHQAVAVARQQR